MPSFSGLDPEWKKAELGYDAVLELTPAELAELGKELVQLVERWAEEKANSNGDEGARKVSVSLRGFPWEP